MNTENRGIQFVKAIIAYLKEKGRKSISFELSTYEDQNDVPFCRRFLHIIDTVSAPCLWDKEEFESMDEAEKKTVLEKGFDQCISICVDDDGCIKYDFFNGEEPEDFDSLFYEIYYYINDADAPEAEEWLKEKGFVIVGSDAPTPDATLLLEKNEMLAARYAEEKGPNLSYCESMDLGEAFPVTLQLAIDPEGFDNKEDALDTLRFLAQNIRFFPRRMRRATFEEFCEYMQTYKTEILKRIEAELGDYDKDMD